MRRIAGGQEAHFAELQRLQQLERRAQVPIVDGIERAAEEPERDPAFQERQSRDVARQRQYAQSCELGGEQREFVPGLPVAGP